MPRIVIKEIKAALFNVVEASDPELFRQIFASNDHPVHGVDLDAHIFDQVANDLGVQLRRLSEDLHDFVTGDYHPKAEALTGSQLGTAAEVISYLLWRSTGREIARVESYLRADGADDFPQPDFLVNEGGKIGVLEIKSTQALSLKLLGEIVESSSRHRWKHLSPCSSVGPRRAEALRQLGYEEGVLKEQLHRLVLRDNREMPFPSDFGAAHVHLVRDGRLNSLRLHQNTRRLKTVPECLAKQRDCWKCLDAVSANEATGDPSQPAHIALVSMHNAPGSLGLIGGGRNAPDWYKSYVRWSQALWASDPLAMDVAQRNLVRSTDAWIEDVTSDNDDAASVLRGMWDRYLGELATRRGLRELGVSPRFETGRVANGFEPRERRPADEPEVFVVEQTPPTWIAQEGTGRLYVLSRSGAESHGRGTSLRVDRDTLEVHSLSRWWWEESRIDEEQAVRVAQDLLEVAWNATLGAEGATFVIRGGLRKVNVRVDSKDRGSVFLGWRFDSRGNWRSITARYGGDRLRATCPWLLALTFGDPRCKLLVHPDGRGYLRIDRQLSVAQASPIWVSFDE